MTALIEFLLVTLKSVDGMRNSAYPYLTHFNQDIEPVWGARTYAETYEHELESAFHKETKMYLSTFKKFKLI